MLAHWFGIRPWELERLTQGELRLFLSEARRLNQESTADAG